MTTGNSYAEEMRFDNRVLFCQRLIFVSSQFSCQVNTYRKSNNSVKIDVKFRYEVDDIVKMESGEDFFNSGNSYFFYTSTQFSQVFFS